MDIATIVGLIAFLTALMIGIGPHLDLVIEAPVLVMVFAGGLALSLVALPLQQMVGLFAVLLRTLVPRISSPTRLIESATHLSEIARAEGILALEAEVDRNPHDPFFEQGIRLAVDGTEPDLIMDILETELQFIEERHVRARKAMRVVGRNCLAMGVMAALVGLALTAGLQAEMPEILRFTALSALYGVVIWALAMALAHKLGNYSELEGLVKRLAIEAVMSIQSGDHPRIVEHKLSVFLPPAMRPSGSYQPTRAELKRDHRLIDEVAELMAQRAEEGFNFADIAKLTDRDMQIALREIDQRSLLVALVGATDELFERFLTNKSDRVRSFLEAEIALLSDTPAEQCANRQAAIAQHVKVMAQQNKLSLPA